MTTRTTTIASGGGPAAAAAAISRIPTTSTTRRSPWCCATARPRPATSSAGCIGYNRAASLIERMEKEGIVGPANHAGKREILVPTEDDKF